MKILIIDDEKLARERIKNLLSHRHEKFDIRENTNGESAVKSIKKFIPDLIFMDINLKDMTGFDVLTKNRNDHKPIVIFVTAHDFYALKAFDYNVFDFLLKPFKKERFMQSLDKAIGFNDLRKKELYDLRLEQLLDTKNFVNKAKIRLPIKTGNKTTLIEISNIKYILADRYYAEVYEIKPYSKHLLRQSLTKLLETLNSDKFCRIHRSTIINLEFVSEIIHSDHNEIDVRMADGKLLRVSRSYKNEVLKVLGI